MNAVLKKMTVVLFVCFLLFSNAAGNAAPLTQDASGALDAALSYLSTQQSPDGGILGLAGASEPGTTARAILALAANEADPMAFTSAEGASVVDYLTENYPAYVYDENGLLFPGNAGLVLAALGTIDAAPSQLAIDLSATLQDDGSYASEASAEFTSGAVTDLNQALALIGLSNAKQDIPVAAVDYLINHQAEDGTWDNGFGPDMDTTAIVVIALLGSGQTDPTHPAIGAALEFFRTNQQENGGWKPDWDTDPLNVDTTGWITHALITTGEDLNNWKQGENTPVSALISQQQPDGSIGGTYVNAYSTVEALLGLAQSSIINPTFSEGQPSNDVQNQAGLVIQLAPDTVIQQCIPVGEGEFFGLDLLKASNLNLDIAVDPAMGALVCGIEGTGCPIDDCFCDMPNYWSYWILMDGEWGYAPTGASTMVVEPDSVHGWSWGEAAPPVVTFDQVCGQAEEVLPTTAPTETEAAVLPEVTNTTEAVVEPDQTEPAIEPTTAVEPELADTNFTLYYVFGGLLLMLVVVIIVVSSKRAEK